MKALFFDSDNRIKDRYNGRDFMNANIVYINMPVQDTTNDIINHHLDADVISVFVSSDVPAEFLSRFKNLKLILARSTGVNNIDLEYCKKNSIAVSNVLGYGEIAVAEFAIGMLLGLIRKIFESAYDMREQRIPADRSGFEGVDINGLKIGVFGTGAIGSHFAKLCHAFGATVIAHDITPNPNLSDIVKYVDLNTLYKESDVVALNIPSNAQNYHIVNSAAIKKMRPGVVILNIARGELINPAALYDGLVSGHIGGLAMDTLEREEYVLNKTNAAELTDAEARTVLFNEKMMTMRNVIFTPHIAYNSVGANMRILDTTYDNLIKFLSGEKIRNVCE